MSEASLTNPLPPRRSPRRRSVRPRPGRPFAGAARRQAAQRGSAMILVLLVMLLLVILGLSLVFVTEIEMALGGAERVVTNNTYAAESGIHAALGGALVTQDWGGERFAILDGQIGDDRMLGYRVVTSRVQGVGPPQSPPLTIANDGQDSYHSFSVVLTTVSQRVSWPTDDPENPEPPIYEEGDPLEDEVTIQAQSTQTAHYFLSPVIAPTDAGEIYNEDDTNTISW